MRHITHVKSINPWLIYDDHTGTIAIQRATIVQYYGVAMISSLLKIIGLFCKRSVERDDILQKKPQILRCLLIVATPYAILRNIV